MLRLIRSILFDIFFVIGSTIIVLLSVLFVPFSKPMVRWGARMWSKYHYLCAWIFLGIRVKIEGKFASGPVLYAIKHESMFETIESLRLFPSPAVIAKKELMSIPVWGTVAENAGLVPIDRDGGASSLRVMMKSAKEAIAEDRPIVIFPEGTRVRRGEQPELQSGFAGLYRMMKLPVVPIAVNSGLAIPRDGYAKNPITITYLVGETIEPGLPRDEIEQRVHAAINALNPKG